MNTFKIVILSIALILSSMPVNTLAGFVLKRQTYGGKIKFVCVMFALSFLMSGAGIWIGNKTSSDFGQTNMWISIAFMLVVGLKVFMDSLRENTEEKTFDFTDNGALFLTALTESISPLGIGIAIGMLSQNPLMHWVVLGCILFAGITSGFVLGLLKSSITFRSRLSLTGGLLIIAVAIKLIVTMVSY